MKKRTFSFDGSQGKTEMMFSLLNHYANVAYPVGGSDCAAASREALQQIAQHIVKAEACGESAELNRRQRPMLKSAVTWFYTDSDYVAPNDPLFQQLLVQFQRKS